MPKISGGGRKIGRNKEGCVKYRQGHRREKNKIRKWKKILKGLPDNNETAIELKNRIKKLEERIIRDFKD
ncbi:hypothetical protein ES705_26590 [subsurface metagenome]